MFDRVEFSKINVGNFVTPFHVIGVFTKSPQYKNANIAIFILAVPLGIE